MERWHHRTQTDVVSSPSVSSDKKLVYIGGTDHILYALNIIDGSVNWYYPTSGSIRSSPLVYKGVVYVGSYDHSFYAIDGATGNLKWVKTIEGDMETSPAVEDYSNVQYNSQISGYLNGAVK
jgi:outer membrane protein assembly factor BamB